MSAPSSRPFRAPLRAFPGIAAAGAVAALLLADLTPARAQSGDCLESECFLSGRIREFRIVDNDTLVVFAGRDRCAFVIDVSGLFCDVTFLPDVIFFRTRDRVLEGQVGRRIGDGGFGRNERICPNNASGFSLETFGFSSLEDEELPRGRPACEVRSVMAASDDDLIELLTIEGIAAPPPPVGDGEISRADGDQRGAGEPARE